MVTLRPARMSDAAVILSWRNHPSVRRASFDSRPISREEHKRWLARVIESPDRILLVGEEGGVPFGTVRFDIDANGRAEVSIAVDPARHGRGLGRKLLHAAVLAARSMTDIKSLLARVKEWNEPSRRLFEGECFTPAAGKDGVITFRLPVR